MELKGAHEYAQLTKKQQNRSADAIAASALFSGEPTYQR
jgi:hypothetical protein